MKLIIFVVFAMFLGMFFRPQDEDEYLRMKKRPVGVSGGSTFLQSIGGGATGSGGIQVCGNSNQNCTLTLAHSTTAKSDMEVMLESYNGTVVTISSAYSCASLTAGVCNAGNAVDTFTLCAASGCNIQNSTNDNVDVAYVAQSAGGANFITINASSDPTSQGFNTYFEEMLPPKCGGVTCNSSVDITVKCSSSSACSSHTIAATDIMIGALDTAFTVSGINYSVEATGNLFALDLTSAPAFVITTAGYWTTSEVFFKTTGGSYPPAPTPFSIVTMSPPPQVSFFNAQSCTPTCTGFSPNASTAGDLIFIYAYGQTISSIAGGRAASWTIPSGAGSCQNTTVGSTSCAYALSAAGNGNSITPTMSGNCTCYFAFIEIGRSSGSFLLDVNTETTSGVGTTVLTGRTQTLNGSTPDVCFQGLTWTTTTPLIAGQYLYPFPGGTNALGTNPKQPAVIMVLLNTTNGAAPVINLSAAATTSESMAYCFK